MREFKQLLVLLSIEPLSFRGTDLTEMTLEARGFRRELHRRVLKECKDEKISLNYNFLPFLRTKYQSRVQEYRKSIQLTESDMFLLSKQGLPELLDEYRIPEDLFHEDVDTPD